MDLSHTTDICHRDYYKLLTGEVDKIVPRMVDNVDEIGYKGKKDKIHLSFRYHQELEQNIVHLVENRSGETIKTIPSRARLESKIRLKKALGRFFDVEV